MNIIYNTLMYIVCMLHSTLFAKINDFHNFFAVLV